MSSPESEVESAAITGDSDPVHLPPIASNINMLNPKMVMTSILLCTTTVFAMSILSIYKFDWVKIIVKHGESILQIEGGSSNQNNQR